VHSEAKFHLVVVKSWSREEHENLSQNQLKTQEKMDINTNIQLTCQL